MIRLLHVEDDADIREIAKLSLELSGGFDVLQCNCGQDALAQASLFEPDVIVLDMMMPGMSGKETLLRMRTISGLSDVPALFMTARADHSDLEDLRAIGAVDVIGKPFDPMTLGAQIRSAMQRAELADIPRGT